MRYRLLQLVLIALLAARIALNVGSREGAFWDFITFYSAGVRAAHGEIASLYAPPAPEVAGEHPAGAYEYVGFPISAFAFAPFGLLSPGWAVRLLKAADAACFALGLWICYRFCRRRVGGLWRSNAAACLYLLIILCFEPFWFVFTIGGQSTPLVFALQVFGVLAYIEGRFWEAAASLSIAILFKPLLSLMVVVFLLAGSWPVVIRLSACLALETALSVLIFGVARHLEWLRMVVRESSRWAVPWWNNVSVVSIAANAWVYNGSRRFGLEPTPTMLAATEVCWRVGLTAAFGWLILGRGRDRRSDEQRQHLVLLAVLFPLFFSTVVWPHYLAFTFLPLAVLIARYHRLSRTAQVLVAVALVSTVRSNRSVFAWLDHAIAPATPPQGVLAGVLGAATLCSLLVLMFIESGEPRATEAAARHG